MWGSWQNANKSWRGAGSRLSLYRQLSESGCWIGLVRTCCPCRLRPGKPAFPATCRTHKIRACIPPFPNQGLKGVQPSVKLKATCLYPAAREAGKCLHTGTPLHTQVDTHNQCEYPDNMTRLHHAFQEGRHDRDWLQRSVSCGLGYSGKDNVKKVPHGVGEEMDAPHGPPLVEVCSVGLRQNEELRNACVLDSSQNQLSSPFIYC